MLIDNIIKILDKSKNDDVDVLVAKDKLIAEGIIPEKDIKAASEFIHTFYREVTKCRNTNNATKLKEFVTAYETDANLFEKIRKEINEL